MLRKLPSERRSRLLSLILLIAAASGLGGCADYLDRRDTLTQGSGDAIASLRAEQMEDPWPVYADNRRIQGNGAVAAAANKRYETDHVKPPAPIDTRNQGAVSINVTNSGPPAPAAE